MPPVVWLLPVHSATHYELLGEAYAMALEALSAHGPVWGISWNPTWPSQQKGYRLWLWNGQGRHIGFWGAWSVRSLRREVERLWDEEGFRPAVIQGMAAHRWASRLGELWQRKYGASLIPSWPFSWQNAIVGLPSSGLSGPSAESKAVGLFVGTGDEKEAAYVAELLALAKYAVWIVGMPSTETPFRSAKHRFTRQIHPWTGLPWIETELYLLRAQVLVATASTPAEVPLLQVGRPWIVPATHPFATMAQGVYTRVEDLPAMIEGILEQSPKQLSPAEFATWAASYYASVAKAS
jgi:hypothetical protein